ncbi:hypothetical protein HKX48_006257 [Thoreauomyces humboldtii]|nr:hypothetical protein HKX48_006257 [Thoreauomyces humboldtii]
MEFLHSELRGCSTNHPNYTEAKLPDAVTVYPFNSVLDMSSLLHWEEGDRKPDAAKWGYFAPTDAFGGWLGKGGYGLYLCDKGSQKNLSISMASLLQASARKLDMYARVLQTSSREPLSHLGGNKVTQLMR